MRLLSLSARGAVFALAVGILDIMFKRERRHMWKAGVLDELAHIITSLWCFDIKNCSDRSQMFSVGLILGSIAIDIDHVPEQIFGTRTLRDGTRRPYSHSLSTLICMLFLFRIRSRSIRNFCVGLALGTTVHFLRDMATGGVPLFWPLTRQTVRVPYWLYISGVFFNGIIVRFCRRIVVT